MSYFSEKSHIFYIDEEASCSGLTTEDVSVVTNRKVAASVFKQHHMDEESPESENEVAVSDDDGTSDPTGNPTFAKRDGVILLHSDITAYET